MIYLPHQIFPMPPRYHERIIRNISLKKASVSWITVKTGNQWIQILSNKQENYKERKKERKKEDKRKKEKRKRNTKERKKKERQKEKRI